MYCNNFIIVIIFLCIGMSHGIEIEISGNATGIGSQDHSLEAAGQLIESVHDSHPDARSWCFLLETHGWQTDGRSVLFVNGTEYRVFENGSIEVI